MTETPARPERSDLDAIAATSTYRELIERLRRRIRESQARAARALNTELVTLYWSIGRDILAQQRESHWGDGVVGRIAQDLAASTGSPRGFSRRNLFYMRRFAALWPEIEKVPSVMAQIGWTAHRVLLDAFADDATLYAWYAGKAAENRWPVRHLKGQIDLRLHERQGAALTNFQQALEPVDADRALEATNHHALRRFVIIDLKIGDFEPEYVSKMNLYLNAVDEQLRIGDDRESVGIILCTSRNVTVAKLALHRVYAPIAVSTWRAGKPLPELPSVEVTDDVPADLRELAELDEVRARLIDRVTERGGGPLKRAD